MVVNEDKYLKLFVNRVKTLLGKRTPYWLAKESGVSQSTISRLLDGKVNPSLSTLIDIARTLEVSPASLISEGEPQRVEVSKTVRHELESGQMEAMRTLIESLREEDPLGSMIAETVPRDIVNALMNYPGDWNLIRAALDLPEQKSAAKKVK